MQCKYFLIMRCWWKRLHSLGNVGRTYFVSSNKHSCCSHKVSLPHTAHSSSSSTEVQSLYPMTWKKWIQPSIISNCHIITLPNFPTLITYLPYWSYLPSLTPSRNGIRSGWHSTTIKSFFWAGMVWCVDFCHDFVMLIQFHWTGVGAAWEFTQLTGKPVKLPKSGFDTWHGDKAVFWFWGNKLLKCGHQQGETPFI